MKNYTKKVPTLVSNTVSNADELSRWILDLNGIQYIDQRHSPGLHIKPSNKAAGVKKGMANNPVLVSTDAVVCKKDGVLNYLEIRCASDRRLYPGDPQRKARAEELFEYFWRNLWRPVGRYFYAHILPYKKYTAPLMKEKVPVKEKFIVNFFYKLLAKAIAKGLKLEEYPPEEELKKIKKVFAKVEDLLSDGRRYLTGDTLTAADMMFAVNAAPITLPPEFGGALAKIENLPDELREQIIEFQNTKAGQFALRIYREHRPAPCDQSRLPKEPSFLSRLKKDITKFFFGKKFRVRLYRWLNKKTVLKLGKKVVVGKHQLVTKLLDRNEEFTIKEINEQKMAALDITFFLGMDKSVQHDREKKMARSVVEKDDMHKIQKFVRQEAQKQTELAQEFKKIDVVNSLTKVVMIRLISSYFGVSGPNEETMKRWLQIFFHDLFLNLGNNKKIHQKALKAADELKNYLEHLIAERKYLMKNDPAKFESNLLNRMLCQQKQGKYEWLDNDTIRRNISGLIVGALSTSSKAIVLILDELFRRPEQLNTAIEAASRDDTETVHQYAYEALRFNPHNPVVLRFAETDQKLEMGEKTYIIKAKSKIYAGISPAMFDPAFFPKPKEFNPSRSLKSYMHFGYGLHECYGVYMNAIIIPEILASVLRLKNIRRASGRAGKILYEGPFPHNFLIEFD